MNERKLVGKTHCVPGVSSKFEEDYKDNFYISFFPFYYYYYYYFLLYNIVLDLPYINMHLPRVYTCSPS